MPAVVEPRFRLSVLTVIVGTALTVPLTLTSCAVAPVLLLVMLPLMPPTEAEAAMRASIVVVSTVPPDSARSRLVCQVIPSSSESSTPVGASMRMSVVRFEPLTK